MIGDKMRKGAELAIEEINARGGVDGRTIEVVSTTRPATPRPP